MGLHQLIHHRDMNNISKPFWKYVKSPKQDNIGKAPLKRMANYSNDSKTNAEILLKQFSSVFNKKKINFLPETHITMKNQIMEIKELKEWKN